MITKQQKPGRKKKQGANVAFLDARFWTSGAIYGNIYCLDISFYNGTNGQTGG
jgi:hypothetical protein